MRRVAVLLLVVVVAGACRAPVRIASQPSLAPGQIVPGSVDTLNATLHALRGKPVVVNYWATWCIPCRAEMPRLAAAATKYGGSVHFLGVDVEDDTKSAEAFARQRDVRYPMMSDPRGAIRSDQRIVGLPVTQFYRSDGALAFVNNGEIQADEVAKRIDDLLIVGKPAAR
jgi:cytochrome c biogenesis protein CcmG, thiol:disulfide interchange protein DsbE